MITTINGRRILSCRQAAQALGVTMGRVRQMAAAGRVWSGHITDRAMVLDAEEIKRLAKARQMARDAGMMPGGRPGGFKAN